MKMCKTCEFFVISLPACSSINMIFPGNCPDGWKGTGSGCYKLFKNKVDKVTRDEAQTMCEKEVLQRF